MITNGEFLLCDFDEIGVELKVTGYIKTKEGKKELKKEYH